MSDNGEYKPSVPFFIDDKSKLSVYKTELDFICQRRLNMGQPQIPENAEISLSTRSNLVGLSLSGGGIRSATFNLGFIQALFRRGILQRVDYLSTVSGGGYIGSCLTALLSSSGGEKADWLWEKTNFPFYKAKEKCEKKIDPSETCYDSDLIGKSTESAVAEKPAVRHLRYFSNYLTAEGNSIRKYFGPLMVFMRGVLLNFLLLAPWLIFSAVALALILSIPQIEVRGYPLHLDMHKLIKGLKSHHEAEIKYDKYIIDSTRNLPGMTREDRIMYIKANEDLLKEESALETKVKDVEVSIRSQLWSMTVIPLAALLIVAGVFILRQARLTTYQHRRSINNVFTWLFFGGFLIFAIQLFGASIVYWNHFNIPNELTFMALLSLIGPRLLDRTTDKKETVKKPWGKIILSIGLMLLVPLVLLYFTGWMVLNLTMPVKWRLLGWMTAGGVLLLIITIKYINVNKISLHNFYRDRLSRAYLHQNDDMKLTEVYSNVNNTGPYHIINTNLNLTKKKPGNQKGILIRNRESFIFSKFWCGSPRTEYIPTDVYERDDKHLDLGTAMAISGAAANIGMGQSNIPGFRLLMALLNIRLGYWVPNPKHHYLSKYSVKKCGIPGGKMAMNEWFGRYNLDDSFINLSDGGHFDNIGVYELLRRRCKYIIVGDAEADKNMKFQAMAYIIRLARIDFGINIDIDLSDMNLDKDTGMSRSHAVVGTIYYPSRTDKGEPEVGYLLYCKSTLTGDEPQHLNEYRIENPSFPHQTTADQWFDEQQFEVYRELGYHVGVETFDPVDEIESDTKLEDVFMQLKQFWYPHSEAVEQSFTKHATELNRIIHLVKEDDKLHFMDAQMFPEWRTLMKGVTVPPKYDLWLPNDMEKIRSGFYICYLMIQLMENVYIDLNLEEQYNHPDNQGWMNLFMHWAWSGVFRVTWAISSCTFGTKFQKFCQKRLRLKMGETDVRRNCEHCDCDNCDICIKHDCDEKGNLPHQKENVVLKRNLNLYEKVKFDEYLNIFGKKLPPRACYVFHLRVSNPRDKDKFKEFRFGFALTDNNNNILYFRVQNHLRRMGMGRKALLSLVRSMSLDSSGQLDASNVNNVSLSEPMRKDTRGMYFNKMLDSVKAELNAEMKTV